MDTGAYDLLPTAVLLLDVEGHVAFANTAAEELFGTSRRALTGERAATLLGDDPTLQSRLIEVAAGRLGVLKQPLSIRRAETAIPVSVSVVPLTGESWSVLMEVREVEQHMLLERHLQLGKELAAQRETLRNLAHEIKNPLGGIRGAAQLLEAELNAPSLHEYTRVIIAEADRLAHLVDRLIAPQGASLKVERFNIHEVCERVRVLVAAEYPMIAIQRDYDASLPELNADFSRLLQAMLNIARNAAQALTEQAEPKSPTLTLRTRVARQVLLARQQARLALVVAVVDNGPGVPSELIEKVFHPLVTGRAEGTGLGLSLAQEFVQQHGGVLECASHPGHTEFRMLLPLEPT